MVGDREKPLLSVRGLKTYFYTYKGIVKAVDNVDLDVKRGETVGVAGESGCGKTVTALSVMRLVPPPGKISGGKVLLNSKNILSLSDKEMRSIRGRRIAMIFQDPMTFLNPVIKIGDQVAEAIMLHQKVSKKDAWERAVEMLEEVRLPSPSKIISYYPHQLSGGMRQRVVIAIALSCNPSLILADEPTTALDVTVQAQVLELIKDLRRKFDTSLWLITHDLGIIADICDKVYIMYAGKIVEFADVYKLFKDPQHPYTIGLLESLLSIAQFKKELKTIRGDVPDLTNPPPGCRFHPRCDMAKSKCMKEEPELVEVSPGHFVSCCLYGRNT